MLIIPAIDIKSNNIVRLEKGDIKKIINYSNNACLVLIKLINLNIKKIHIVDLDGAINGKPNNLFVIKLIRFFLKRSIKIQIGGGIRNIDIINYYFDLGLSNLIIGTKVFNDIKFLKFISEKFPYKIILGLDLNKNKIVLNGWNTLNENFNLSKFLFKIKNFRLNSIIYTDILKDGMLSGLNLNFIKIFKNFKFNIYFSGGLRNINDYKNCFNKHKFKLVGFICGKSLYNNKFNYNNVINVNNHFNKYYIF